MPKSSSKRVELVVDIYESAGAVRGHGPDTEMEDTDTERLNTPQTGRNTAWGRCYILTVVCLLVLCVLLLTGIIVMWIKFNNLDTKTNQLQTSYNTLTTEKDQLQTRYNTLTKERDQLQTRYHTLTKERDQLERERDEYIRTFCNSGKCVWFSSSYYYMSNDEKTWLESRKDCRDKGADLVIINSTGEQDFIGKQLVSSVYWIGLINRVEEGTWKWVDTTPLTTEYWDTGKPNGHCKLNCAEIYRNSNRIVWNDNDCSKTQRWICEKHISQ